jgi:hypothetical protein
MQLVMSREHAHIEKNFEEGMSLYGENIEPNFPDVRPHCDIGKCDVLLQHRTGLPVLWGLGRRSVRGKL